MKTIQEFIDFGTDGVELHNKYLKTKGGISSLDTNALGVMMATLTGSVLLLQALQILGDKLDKIAARLPELKG